MPCRQFCAVTCMPIRIKAPEEWGIERVPASHRVMGKLDFFVLWSSLGVGLLVLQAGQFLTMPGEAYGFGFGMLDAALIALVGSVIGSLLLALAGVVGEREGVPTMVSLRPSFGLFGSYLPTILNIIQLIGWTTFEIIIMGDAAESISGIEGSGPIWIVFFGVLAILMAVWGPLRVVREWLEKFAIWLVYLSTIYITYSLLSSGVELPLYSGSNLSTYLLALDLVIAMPISWMPLVSDYNRFSRGYGEGFKGTFVGYTTSNFWFYTLGAALYFIYPGETVVRSIATLFFGQLALLLILVDETDNAFADVYSASVSLQNINDRIGRHIYVAAVGIVSIILGLTIPIVEYENFLLLIGASFVPVVSILLADYFIVKGGRYSDAELYSDSGVKLPALVTWVIGFVAYYYFAYIYQVIGATLPSFITTFLVYSILGKVLGVVR